MIPGRRTDRADRMMSSSPIEGHPGSGRRDVVVAERYNLVRQRGAAEDVYDVCHKLHRPDVGLASSDLYPSDGQSGDRHFTTAIK